ncbi:MAG: hypothetical protein ABI068_03150 [Ktedonobacterales bacterium]
MADDPLTVLNQALTDPFNYYALLTLGALVVAVYGWRKRIAWAQRGLVIVWLLLATLVALVAACGAGILIANPIAVSYLATVGQWRISLGLYLTFAALALLGVGTGVWLFTSAIEPGSLFTGGQLAGNAGASSETAFDDDTAPELAALE